MDQGVQWRIAIIGTATTLLIQLIVVIVFFSRLGKQVEINTERLDKAEMAVDAYYITKTQIEDRSDEMKEIQSRLGKICERLAVIEKVSYGYQDYLNGKRTR